MIRLLFGWLYFWYYYTSKKIHPKEKDNQLEDLYKDILLSNISLIIYSSLLLKALADYVGAPLLLEMTPLMIFLTIILVIVQTVFQLRRCLDAMKRKAGITSIRAELKEGFAEVATMSRVLVGVTVDIATEKLAKELKKLFEEFYGHYEENSQKTDRTYDTNEENFHTDANSSNEITRIFDKYNLPHDSDLNSIKKHFRNLAKKYHPDMPTGDEKKFIELREDLELLIRYSEMQDSA